VRTWGFLELRLNDERDRTELKDARVISRDSSKVKVLVVPVDGKLAIALETLNVKERTKPF